MKRKNRIGYTKTNYSEEELEDKIKDAKDAIDACDGFILIAHDAKEAIKEDRNVNRRKMVAGKWNKELLIGAIEQVMNSVKQFENNTGENKS